VRGNLLSWIGILGDQVGGYPYRSMDGCIPLEMSGEFRDKASGDLVYQWLYTGEFRIKPANLIHRTLVSNINIIIFFTE
jgi:hypothetical protein